MKKPRPFWRTRGTSDKPAILVRSTAILAALAILAQGFLAVHAELRDDRWGPHEIAEALRAMDWPEFAGRAGVTRSWRTETREAVRDPAWWAATFGDVSNLADRVLAEWGQDRGDRAAVEQLARTISKGGRIDETMVAKAFLALRQRLRRPARGT